MSAARTARRRRRQWANGHGHLARIGKHKAPNRPVYRRANTLITVSDAIARERAQAAREARIKAKRK